MKKHVLVTHNDIDGAGAATLFKYVCEEYGLNYEIHTVGVDEVDKVLYDILNLGNIASLYIIDISPKDSGVINILATMYDDYNIQLLDHHETAALRFKEYGDWAEFNDECGTMQFFYYLSGKYDVSKYDKFTKLVDVYDRYQTEDNLFAEARRLNILFTLLGIEDFVNRMIDGRPYSELLDKQESDTIDLIEKENQQYMNKKIESIRAYEYDSVKFACIFADRLANEISEELRFLEYNQYSFVAVIDISELKVSLRSIDPEFNVGEFAKNFSKRGGGHTLSGGFSLNEKATTALFAAAFSNYKDEDEE